MTSNSEFTRLDPGSAPAARFVRQTERTGIVTRLTNLLLSWQDRARQRHTLAQMDDRTLADLGLSRIDVASEIHKGFWQL